MEITLIKLNMIRRKKKALTLIEIIIVVALIAIITAITTPRISSSVKEARTAGVVTNGQSILGACEQSIAKTLETPLTTELLTTELTKLGLTNPITKGGAAFVIGPVPATNPVKGCVYVEITNGDATSILNVTLHRIDAYGVEITPSLKAGL